MSDYRESIKEWLNERAPVNFETNDVRYIDAKRRRKRYGEQITELKQKARISVKWRLQLSERLRIVTDDIVRGTNTILELIEQSLASGEPVRLANFGDFVLINGSEGEKKWVRFRPARAWLEEINEPQWVDKIGLLRSYQKGRLARRQVADQSH